MINIMVVRFNEGKMLRLTKLYCGSGLMENLERTVLERFGKKQIPMQLFTDVPGGHHGSLSHLPGPPRTHDDIFYRSHWSQEAAWSLCSEIVIFPVILQLCL